MGTEFSSLSFEVMLNVPVEFSCNVGENRTFMLQVPEGDKLTPKQFSSTTSKGAEGCTSGPMERSAVPVFCTVIERSEKLTITTPPKSIWVVDKAISAALVLPPPVLPPPVLPPPVLPPPVLPLPVLPPPPPQPMTPNVIRENIRKTRTNPNNLAGTFIAKIHLP
jgi:hypothetical protein